MERDLGAKAAIRLTARPQGAAACDGLKPVSVISEEIIIAHPTKFP